MERIYLQGKGLSLKKYFEKDFFKMKRLSTSDEKEFYFEMKTMFFSITQIE